MSYTKTNWVNDTTPINATNLNHIEDGIKGNETLIGDLSTLNTTDKTSVVNAINETLNKPYYVDGDTFEANSDYFPFIGLITGSSKDIRFTIPLPKSTANITSVTINNLTLNIRGITGYVPATSTDFLNEANTSSTTARISNNLLSITISGTNAWSNATNNTPISVCCIGLKVTFNE